MGNKIKILFCGILLLNSIFVYSIENTDSLKLQKNAIAVNLLGNGYLYSLSYERYFIQKNKWSASAKIGISYYYRLYNSTYIPISAQVYYGYKSKLELGIGYTPIFRWSSINEEGTIFNYDKSKYTLTGTKYIKGHNEPYAGTFCLNVGWQKELRRNNFFKIQFSPWISKAMKGYGIIPWGAITLGKMF